MHPTGLDPYKPAEIAALVETAGAQKARLPLPSMATLAVLAGVFIGLGAAAYTVTMTGADASFGPHRILGGLVFSLGLILVIVGGAELFTGNALMVMAAVDRKITVAELCRNWLFVYLGNFAGAVALAYCFYLAGFLDGATGQTAARIAEAKVALESVESFFRGILCNVLVCLAVWLTLAARTVTGKILSILWPITSFVALGLEHSVANMYLIPQGMLAGASVSIAQFLDGLVFVTLGNIAGGAGGIALAYRFAYGDPASK